MPVGNTFSQVAVSIPYDNSTDGWVSNNVQAAIEEAPLHLRVTEVNASSSVTAPTTNTIMTGMSIAAPATGTYMVWFSCDILSSTAGASVTAMIGVSGVAQAGSTRVVLPYPAGLGLLTTARCGLALNGYVSATAGQTIEIWWSTSSSGPSVNGRTLDILRIT